MGGNASKSYRVAKFFKELGVDNNFKLYEALPTEVDEEGIKNNVGGSYRTAKTGVAVGLIYSKLGELYIVNGENVKYPQLAYHIGKRLGFDYNGDDCPEGRFALKLCASDFCDNRYYLFGCITDAITNIYYTDSPEYGLKVRSDKYPSAEGLDFVALDLEDHLGKYLYCSVVEGAPTKVSLGVSEDGIKESLSKRNVTVIGVCDFSKKDFYPIDESAIEVVKAENSIVSAVGEVYLRVCSSAGAVVGREIELKELPETKDGVPYRFSYKDDSLKVQFSKTSNFEDENKIVTVGIDPELKGDKVVSVYRESSDCRWKLVLEFSGPGNYVEKVVDVPTNLS